MCPQSEPPRRCATAVTRPDILLLQFLSESLAQELSAKWFDVSRATSHCRPQDIIRQQTRSLIVDVSPPQASLANCNCQTPPVGGKWLFQASQRSGHGVGRRLRLGKLGRGGDEVNETGEKEARVPSHAAGHQQGKRPQGCGAALARGRSPYHSTSIYHPHCTALNMC